MWKSTLLTTNKRSRLDYADTIYNQGYNSAFYDKLESFRYNACLAINGAIRGTSTGKMYQELGLESLKSRRWFRKLNRVHNARFSYNIPQIKVIVLKTHFFSSALSECNKSDFNIRNSASLNTFKIKLTSYSLVQVSILITPLE